MGDNEMIMVKAGNKTRRGQRERTKHRKQEKEMKARKRIMQSMAGRNRDGHHIAKTTPEWNDEEGAR